MTEFPTQQILKFARAEKILEINLAIIYVIFILAKYGVIDYFFPIRKTKNLENLEEYISNLEWFQVIQKEDIKT
jgi:hypothetical protein